MGVVGLETAFSALYTHLVKPGILPLDRLLDLMHANPARRFGFGTPLEAGQPADLTAFDLDASYTVDPEQFATMGRATPFAGMKLWGVCRLTMNGGKLFGRDERETAAVYNHRQSGTCPGVWEMTWAEIPPPLQAGSICQYTIGRLFPAPPDLRLRLGPG